MKHLNRWSILSRSLITSTLIAQGLLSSFGPSSAYAGAYVPHRSWSELGPAPIIAYGSLTLPSFPTTRQPDGIDIYPSHPSDDGDDDYVHVDIKSGGKYVFHYCNNGVSPALAKLGYHPTTRSCGTLIGRASGYTMAELKSEIKDASDTAFWETTDDVLKTFLTAAAVFIVIGASDAATDGAAAPANVAEATATIRVVDEVGPVASEGAHVVAADATKLAEVATPALEGAARAVALTAEKVASPVEKIFARIPNTSNYFFKASTWKNASKAAWGAVATTGATALVGWGTSSVTLLNARIDDNNGSPTQIRAHSIQFLDSISSGCVFITPDNIQTFYHQISAILSPIPGN